MTVANALRQRLAQKGYDNPSIKNAVESMTGIYDSVTAKRDEVQKDSNLSPQGRLNAMRKFAEKHVASIRQQQQAVEKKHTDVEKQREDLRRPKFNIDRNDVLGALLHVRMGEKLSEMTPAQRMALLTGQDADPRMLAAAFELPSVITGLSSDELAKVEKSYVELNHGPALKQIEEESDAVELASQAVQTATKLVYEVCGFTSRREFEDFVTKFSAKPEPRKETIAGLEVVYASRLPSEDAA